MHGNDFASAEGFVDTKLRRKKINSSKWEDNCILKLQQSQPVPVGVNRYTTLAYRKNRRHPRTIKEPVK